MCHIIEPHLKKCFIVLVKECNDSLGQPRSKVGGSRGALSWQFINVHSRQILESPVKIAPGEHIFEKSVSLNCTDLGLNDDTDRISISWRVAGLFGTGLGGHSLWLVGFSLEFQTDFMSREGGKEG